MRLVSPPALRGWRLLCYAVALPLAACMQFTMQQGNVIKPEKLADIHVEDSRFHVESLIGTPVLRDAMHPNRAIYVDDYNNPDTDETHQRRVEIIYSDAGRVKSIRLFGFGRAAGKDETAKSRD